MPLEDEEAPEGEFDAADPKQVNKRKQRAKLRAAEDEIVLKNILATDKGRAWLWRLLGHCHIFDISFRGDGELNMAFREGERNIGNRLLTQIVKVSTDSFVLMMKENSNA